MTVQTPARLQCCLALYSPDSFIGSLLNNSGLDGRGIYVCWNPDCRCRLLPESRRLPFSGFLPLDVSSPAAGDILRSGRCRCVRCRGSQLHISFSNSSVALLRHSSFSNPSFASPTSQALYLRHLTSRPCYFSIK